MSDDNLPERRSEDQVLRKLEILDMQIRMTANSLKVLSQQSKENNNDMIYLIERLEKRLERIEDFEKSITGSWKGVVFTVIVIWAAFGEKFKSFFH